VGLQIERAGDVVVIVPAGRLEGGRETEALGTALTQLVDTGQRKILLDLGQTTFMASRAIGILVSAHTRATERNLHLWICFGPGDPGSGASTRGAGTLSPVIQWGSICMDALSVCPTREEALRKLAEL